MKKIIPAALSVLLIITMLLTASCNKGGGDDPTETNEPESVTAEVVSFSEMVETEIVTDEEGSTEVQTVLVTVPVTSAPTTAPKTTDGKETEPAATEGAPATTEGSKPATTEGSKPSTTAAPTPGTTTVPGTTKAPSGTQADNEDADRNITSEVRDIATIRTGTFYIAGNTEAGGETSKMAIASENGGIVYMGAEMDMDGQLVSIAILKRDNKTYLLYPTGKMYVELTAQAMKMFGLEEDEFNSLTDIDLTSITKSDMKLLGTDTATLGGKNVTVRKYEATNGGEIWYYTDGDTLLRMENYTTSGNMDTVINFDTIQGTIPESVTSIPKDYEPKSIAAFVKELGPLLGVDF